LSIIAMSYGSDIHKRHEKTLLFKLKSRVK
jgi:hypothetical protein